MMRIRTSIALQGVMAIAITLVASVAPAYAKDCDQETSGEIFKHIRNFGYTCDNLTYCSKSDHFPIWNAQCDGKSTISQTFRIANHNGRQKLKIDGQDICYVLTTGERLSGLECKY